MPASSVNEWMNRCNAMQWQEMNSTNQAVSALIQRQQRTYLFSTNLFYSTIVWKRVYIGKYYWSTERSGTELIEEEEEEEERKKETWVTMVMIKEMMINQRDHHQSIIWWYIKIKKQSFPLLVHFLFPFLFLSCHHVQIHSLHCVCMHALGRNTHLLTYLLT